MPSALQLLRQRRNKLAEEVELRDWYSGDPSPQTTLRMKQELRELDELIEKATPKRRRKPKGK